MLNFKTIIKKTPPQYSRNHQRYCYLSEYFDFKTNKVLIDELFDKKVYSLITKISKYSKFDSLKIYIENSYDVILRDWVFEKISHFDKKKSSYVPKSEANMWINHLLSIANLGLKKRHLDYVNDFIDKVRPDYLENMLTNSITIVDNEFSREEIEFFVSYFIDSQLIKKKVSKSYLLNELIKNLTRSKHKFHLTKNFKKTIKKLSHSIINEGIDYHQRNGTSSMKQVYSFLNIEFIIGMQKNLKFNFNKIENFDRLINQTINNPTIFLFNHKDFFNNNLVDVAVNYRFGMRPSIIPQKSNLEFLRFLKKINYVISKEVSKIYVDIILKYLKLLEQVERENYTSTNGHFKYKLYIQNEIISQYFELFLYFFTTLPRSKQYQKLVDFIKIIDEIRKFYGQRIPFFKKFDNFTNIKGELNFDDRNPRFNLAYSVKYDKSILEENKYIINTYLESQRDFWSDGNYKGNKRELDDETKKIKRKIISGFIHKRSMDNNGREYANKLRQQILNSKNYKLINPIDILRSFFIVGFGKGNKYLTELAQYNDEIKNLVDEYNFKAFCPLIEIFSVNTCYNIFNLKNVLIEDIKNLRKILDTLQFQYNPETLNIIFENFKEIKSNNPQLVTVIKKTRPHIYKKLFQKSIDFKKIAEIHRNNKTINGLIYERKNGGFFVKIFSWSAFLPQSQIDVKKRDWSKTVIEFDQYLGRNLEVTMI